MSEPEAGEIVWRAMVEEGVAFVTKGLVVDIHQGGECVGKGVAWADSAFRRKSEKGYTEDLVMVRDDFGHPSRDEAIRAAIDAEREYGSLIERGIVAAEHLLTHRELTEYSAEEPAHAD